MNEEDDEAQIIEAKISSKPQNYPRLARDRITERSFLD